MVLSLLRLARLFRRRPRESAPILPGPATDYGHRAGAYGTHTTGGDQ